MGESGSGVAKRIDEPSAHHADQLRDVCPPLDRLAMEAARERIQRLLFGSAAPAKFGRYVLVGSGTNGGMGIVYAAYDPELHRKVALKVLHPRRQAGARAHDRLIIEARALARLDHPNVVKVHDVITQDEQVVIVMEWVEGKTLADWESERLRSWREIVAVYSQAGLGLAAAHGVGVVHRDFKPSNVIVGTDGRVRVLDFGLARSASLDPGAPSAYTNDHIETASPEPDVWAVSLTATGDMVGTLAFAAPEQIAGELANSASDQFSFGVSLYRALEGTAPFAGRTAEELVNSIRSGRLATVGDVRDLPSWLRSIVRRAITWEPAARFPSMSALLQDLTRPRGWRRWRIPFVVGTCLVIAALAWFLHPGESDPLANCDGGRAEIGSVWNRAERSQVAVALTTAVTTRDADQIRERVLRGIDDYREHWSALHRDACVAHRSGEQSAILLDRRMLCMQKRLGDLRATVTVLEQLDAASASNAVDIVARMPKLADCADAESLQAETAPPSTVRRATVDAVRMAISHALALNHAGRSTEALAAATTAVEAAEQTGYPPIVADAALLQGQILMARQQFHLAIGALERARGVALENRQFAVAVEAAARKIFVENKLSADPNILKRDLDIFLPLAKAVPGDHFARPLLLNNIGTVYMAAGDRAEATRYFQEAHAILRGVAGPDLELAFVDMNIAMLTPDAATREDLAHGVWQHLRRELGDSHLWTLAALSAYARYVQEPSRALPLLVQACIGYDTFHPQLVEQRVYCESYRAFLAGELGDHTEELRCYDEIFALAAGVRDGDTAARGGLAAGYAGLLRGDTRTAVAALEKIARVESSSPSWWLRALAGHAELGLGVVAHVRKRDDEAARHLEHALTIYSDVIRLNEEAEWRSRMALARRTLVSLQRTPGGQGRAP